MKKLLGVSTTIAAGLMLASGAAIGATELQPVPEMTDEEYQQGQQIYFDRCSGCHGALRKGATGKNITPEKTRLKTLAALDKILYEGTEGGMPGWGKDGFMTREETQLMAKFVQNEVPKPPEWGMKEMN
ncbi:MAG: cytochrome c, partial [Arenicellales bacterium]|nr:cytochrome c [Arenicellales bacterium]